MKVSPWVQEFCLQEEELKLVILLSFLSYQPRIFTKMLFPQWILVPTSSIRRLSLPVPHCFSKTHWCVACAKPYSNAKERAVHYLPKNQTDLRLWNAFCINLFVPALLLQLWLSAKIISNQFSICFQCWYSQLISSLQRPDVPHVVSYRS